MPSDRVRVTTLTTTSKYPLTGKARQLMGVITVCYPVRQR